jgi:hypothetical protein
MPFKILWKRFLQLEPELVGSRFDFLMEIVETKKVDAGEKDLNIIKYNLNFEKQGVPKESVVLVDELEDKFGDSFGGFEGVECEHKEEFAMLFCLELDELP